MGHFFHYLYIKQVVQDLFYSYEKNHWNPLVSPSKFSILVSKLEQNLDVANRFHLAHKNWLSLDYTMF